MILFFDEINTNPNVSGILKELLVDRKLLGRNLPGNVVPIGAANPYKLRKQEDRKKDSQILSSKFVYLVHPLPESMLTFVWDFGSLKPEDELKYILKITEKATSDFYELKQKVDECARVLWFCQKYARRE